MGEKRQWSDRERPWRDEEILRELYREEGNTCAEIADLLDCHKSTIFRWIREHNLTKPESASYFTNPKGYEHWCAWNGEDTDHCKVHRLVAVAEFGFEAVKGNDVHHKNGNPWDNRHENLEIVGHGEHARRHRLEEDRDWEEFARIGGEACAEVGE